MQPDELTGPVQPDPEGAEVPPALAERVIDGHHYNLPAPQAPIGLRGPWPRGFETTTRRKDETPQEFWERCEKKLAAQKVHTPLSFACRAARCLARGLSHGLLRATGSCRESGCRAQGPLAASCWPAEATAGRAQGQVNA